MLAKPLPIKNGDKVLDAGCGVGGPAREIEKFTGAHITPISALSQSAYLI